MKAILVDDEPLALEILKKRIHQVGNVEVTGMYTNPLHAKEAIRQETVDVVFLDINLPEMNGLELAEKLLEIHPELQIVFVTAYDEYAVRAFEINALDYLVKPINKERLTSTILRLKKHLQKTHTYKESDLKDNVPLRVQMLGQFSIVSVEGEEIFPKWRTKKARELFLYLLHHRETLVRKSLLIDLLWPDIDPKRAHSLMYTTVYYVRKMLSEYQNYFNIKNNTEGYILETQDVMIDVEEWERGLQNLSFPSKSSICQYEGLMSLYRGGYLEEYDYLWAEADNERLAQLWLSTALEMAAFYKKTNKIPEAKLWYTRICQFHPEVEVAHLELMKIYADEGVPTLVQKQMQKLTKFLKNEMDVIPSKEILQWYMQWQKSVKKI